MGPIKGFQPKRDADAEFAAGLLSQGDSTEAVKARLVERGLSAEAADALISRVYTNWVYDEAAGMLDAGLSPATVKEALAAKGVPRDTVNAVVDDMAARRSFADGDAPAGGTSVRQVVGGVIVVIGFVLLIGNWTGLLRTFPFAGFIAIAVGGAIAGSK